MKNNSKIAIVAGGTGGHIFPAISLLEQLINEKKEIIFFSDTRVKNIINEIETGERTTGNIDVTMQAVETQFGVAHSDLLGGARVELPVKDRTLYIPGG